MTMSQMTRTKFCISGYDFSDKVFKRIMKVKLGPMDRIG